MGEEVSDKLRREIESGVRWNGYGGDLYRDLYRGDREANVCNVGKDMLRSEIEEQK